ncbi:MAG: heavy metal translocating P-type ATPase [Candidatus Saccharimonas sp.]
MSKLKHFSKLYYKLLIAAIVGIASAIAVFMGMDWLAQWMIGVYGLVIAGVLGWGMVQTLRNGQFGVDILAVMAIISTTAVEQYWATLVIVFMLLGGEALEDFANRRAQKELTDLLKRAPKIAHRLGDDGPIVDIPVDVIAVGDTLLVKPGEIVPVDATIVEGDGLVDESSLTGESLPVTKTPGDHLLSGTVNGDTALTVEALHTASDSQYAQIVQLVQAAADSRAPFVRLADRYAVPFTAISFVIAGVAWWLSGDPVRFAEVLVVATPCPLLIAAPVALISGMSRSAKHGIIIKNGGILERLARVKTVVFDKTGTLTTGQLSVWGVVPAHGVSEEELIRLAASADASSAHILATSLVRYAEYRGIKTTESKDSVEVPGKGVAAIVDRRAIVVGSKAYMKERGIQVPEDYEINKTALFAARDGVYLGSISFADTVRENSAETITRLKTLGIHHVAMLTGDHRRTALKIGGQLGIDDIHAECLPSDKLAAIRAFREAPVMMVGDGVNDAPVLAASDVGVAMGARGSTAASESADVVVLLDDISRVPLAIAIAQKTLRIALQSVLLGIAISIILMLVAATGRIPAVVGAGLQEFVDAVVIVNALRAHGGLRRR